MNNPFIWLGVSILLVSISLIALLTVAILTLQELAKVARSAEKLLDTLNRELPATLSDLRLTGKDLSNLTDEVSGSVQSARNVVEQVDRSILDAKVHAKKAQATTHSFFAGANAALKVLIQAKPRRRRRPPTRRPAVPISPKTTSTSLVSKDSANIPSAADKTSKRNTEKPVKKPVEETHPTLPPP